PPASTAVLTALWGLALVVTVVLVHQRYRDALSGSIGADFLIYLHAARLVAAGHSPYWNSGTFVYPATLALLLAPFAHAEPLRVFRGWTVLELAALLVGIGAFVATVAPEHRAWLRPILFTFCAVTVFHFWPLTIGLYLGQADAFVFAALMLSSWAARRSWPATRDTFIGVSGLLKTWPAAAVVSECQQGTERRLRTVAAVAVTVLIAPVLAVALGGGPDSSTSRGRSSPPGPSISSTIPCRGYRACCSRTAAWPLRSSSPPPSRCWARGRCRPGSAPSWSSPFANPATRPCVRGM
ncbi:MAG TPA: glycosyltransferase family 87 protein, partial [Acidimicrobiales bacterium]|nr:glycosyltransferase family 87 protein [Acidimicrobiales bacterium]